jgi:ubiquinone/menaquinone biosynthesis C-methylase UbiE
MATHYPDCHFTGVQLAAEMMQNVPALQNVTFKDGDVLTQGIPCNDSSIDYIHLRCAGAIVSLEKWPKLFSEINRVLKPEGVVRIEELDHSVKHVIKYMNHNNNRHYNSQLEL